MPHVHIHPPGTGIMHTINLEQLATVLRVPDVVGMRLVVRLSPGVLSSRAVPVRILGAGREAKFDAMAAVETQFEVQLLLEGGVIPHILNGRIANG